MASGEKDFLQEERELMKNHKLTPLTDFWTQFVKALNASGTKTYTGVGLLTKATARDTDDYNDFMKLNRDIRDISVVLNNHMRKHGLKDILTKEEEVKMSTVNFFGATVVLDVMAYFMKKYSLDEEGKPRKFETKPISSKERLSYIKDVCRLASYGNFADEVRWFAEGFSGLKGHKKTGEASAFYFGLDGRTIDLDNVHSMIVSYPLTYRHSIIEEFVKKTIEKQFRLAFEEWFKGKIDGAGAWIAMRLEKGPEFMELTGEEPFMKLAYKKARSGQINEDFVDWIEKKVSPIWKPKKVLGSTVGRQWSAPLLVQLRASAKKDSEIKEKVQVDQHISPCPLYVTSESILKVRPTDSSNSRNGVALITEDAFRAPTHRKIMSLMHWASKLEDLPENLDEIKDNLRKEEVTPEESDGYLFSGHLASVIKAKRVIQILGVPQFESLYDMFVYCDVDNLYKMIQISSTAKNSQADADSGVEDILKSISCHET